jgi:hypothetical protein
MAGARAHCFAFIAGLSDSEVHQLEEMITIPNIVVFNAIETQVNDKPGIRIYGGHR